MTPNQKNQVWAWLNAQQNVMVIFMQAHTEEEVVPLCKPLLDWLRACGFKEETDTMAQLSNDAWIFCKPQVAVPIPPNLQMIYV